MIQCQDSERMPGNIWIKYRLLLALMSGFRVGGTMTVLPYVLKNVCIVDAPDFGQQYSVLSFLLLFVFNYKCK